MKNRNMRLHPRRSTPKPTTPTIRRELTLGELISAACEALPDERAVMRVLRSRMLAERIGRRLVFH